jgi:hypothetical protein
LLGIADDDNDALSPSEYATPPLLLVDFPDEVEVEAEAEAEVVGAEEGGCMGDVVAGGGVVPDLTAV